MPLPDEKNVRLSDQERQGIRDAVCRASQETGIRWRRIVLFGSRVDPARKGGDIDLLIEVLAGDSYRFRQRLALALEDAIGEQKVDLVIDDGASGEQAFIAIAHHGGVELWTND